MITLQPIRFPRPVPIPIWTDDYADLPERIRRDGRLDTEEIWTSHSGDSFEAFCSRHGTYGFEWDWPEWTQRIRQGADQQSYRQHEADAAWRQRQAEQARQQQEQWEAERREREQAKQAKADREWQEIEEAKAYWSQRRPSYATEPYRAITVATTGKIDGVELQGGKSYWVPHSIAHQLRAYAKTHNLDTVD